MTLHHVPNLLSLFRLAMIPLLGGLAFSGHSGAFLLALLASLASDVLDGWLARRSGVATPLGAKLDSYGDLATYTTLPLFAWWLWPELLRAEWRTLACAAFAYALPIAVGLLRFRRLTSYHTWLAKGTALAMGVALFVWFSGGPAWPFQAAVFLLVVEAFEEVAISCVLRRPRSDVPTLWHALHAGQSPSSSRDASSSASSLDFTVRRSMPRRRAASS